VQDHRVRGDQFFPFEPVDNKVGRLGEVELGKLGADRGEPFDRAHIIVLVVAQQDFLGNALDRLGIKGQGLGLIGHGPGSGWNCGLRQSGPFDEGRRRGGARSESDALDEVPSFNTIHFPSPLLGTWPGFAPAFFDHRGRSRNKSQNDPGRRAGD